MKFVYPEYGIEIPFVENQIPCLVLEHPTAFSRITTDLWKQTQGEEGEVLISEGDKIYSLSKELVFIPNPFSVSSNDRKIVSKLHHELTTVATEEMWEPTQQLNASIVQYLDHLLHRLPYPLHFELEMDVTALLKMYGVSVEGSADTLLEQLIQYLQVMHQICHVKVFVLLNIKQYFTEEEIQSLYEFVFYEKIHILLVENGFRSKFMHEKYLILDQDLCIINMQLD
jgi:CRISPR type II-A-associated protein Csn2